MKSYAVLAAKLLREMQEAVPLTELYRRFADCEQVHRFEQERVEELLKDQTTKNHAQLAQEIRTYQTHLGNGDVDFFDVLDDFSGTMIVQKDGTYQFRYRFTDIWRNYNQHTDEDIVVANAVYFDDMRRCCDRKQFDWPFCVEHDNNELHTILRRGMAENHFHLRGSSPFFYISWVYLMNHPCSEVFRRKISAIEKNKLNHAVGTIRDETLVQCWQKAAAIRVFLYTYIHGIALNSDIFGKHNFYDCLKKFLTDNENAYLSAYHIQSMVRELIVLCPDIHTTDYANNTATGTKYRSFSGERALEYHVLKYIHEYRKDHEMIRSLFFIYLVLKNRFHMELVQTNGRKGFYNFLEYQNRKDDFIPWSYDTERMIAADTISSVLENEGIQSVELRISPPSDLRDGVKILNTYLLAIEDAKSSVKTDTAFFFTFHFIKHPYAEPMLEKEKIQYRHFDFRKHILRQAQILLALRQREINLAEYIVGIDASGDEMDCRPEYFGCIFRLLQHYEPPGHPPHKQQIRATFHVGEDNYDILDGLRAIDEAVLFLDLRSGSRLGHANALGLSVRGFYQKLFDQSHELSIPKAVFLDNIIWLREYIRKLNIQVEQYAELMQFISDEFQKLFTEIYGHSVSQLVENCMHADAQMMLAYYHAWLLRSDDPELYSDYKSQKPLIPSEEYKICTSIPEMTIARNDETARLLCHLYQYEYEVKVKGFDSYRISLPSYFIAAIHEVQKFMRIKLTQQGIGIETNPSSNLSIAPLDDYSEHPISVFYRNRLQQDPEEAQMNVSINTDDKSIFSTCLSNEYAYLAFALENHQENGKYCYTHFDVFHWIDEIRIMGLEQSFIRSDETERNR